MKIQKTVHQFFQNLISSFDQPNIKNIFDILVFSAIVGIALYMFGPNLDAGWWYRDDHENMYLSPSYQRMDYRDILPTLLTKTEINPDSTLARYRPVYYVFRLLETRFWLFSGAKGWYFTRIIIFIWFISILYITFRKFNGRIVGSLLALLMTTFTFLSDVISRLSPSESYAMFGLGVFLIGVLLFTQKHKNSFAWLLMMLGEIILVGNKENMGIFIFPFIFIFIYYLTEKPEKKLFPGLTVFISGAFSLWVYAEIGIRIFSKGSDIYMHSVGMTERLSALVSFVNNNLFVIILLTVLLITGLIGLLINKCVSKTVFRWLFWGSSFILMLIFSQVYFYANIIFDRYNFPYLLYIPLTISLIVYFFQHLALSHHQKTIHLIITLIAAIALIFFIKPSQWQEIRDYSNENVNRTHYFNVRLNSIKKFLTENPDSVLILYGNKPGGDYEMNISYSRFIKFSGIENDIYILRDLPPNYESNNTEYNVAMEKRLLGYSENGSEIYGISPLSKFAKNPQKCLMVNLVVDHEAPVHCDEVIDGNLSIKFKGLFDKKE